MKRLVTLTDEDISLINSLIDRHPDIYSDGVKIKNKLSKAQGRITHTSAKAKGRSWQYDVCEKISKILNIPYDQQNDDCLIQSRPMAQQGVDIILRGEARKLFPFDIECKSMKELNIHSAVKQADENALESEGRVGMVAYKQTNMDPIVVFSWDSFVKMYTRYILKSQPV